MFKNQLILKLLLIALLACGLTQSLSSIQYLIHERQSYQAEAQAEVAQGWSDEQLINGPILCIPYQRITQKAVWDTDSRSNIIREEKEENALYLAPEQLSLTSALQTEQRYKGIYSFPVYTTQVKATGNVDLAPLQTLLKDPKNHFTSPPRLIMGIRDSRGIVSIPQLNWAGKEIPFQPGTASPQLKSGIHADLPLFSTNLTQTVAAFNLSLELRGMGQLRFIPVGKETRLNLTANWPHPSFTGPFPPSRRVINHEGFQADWSVSYFSTQLGDFFLPGSKKVFDDLDAKAIGIDLIQPVNTYLISERSVKYGFLLIGFTFAAFFLYEVLRRLRIHPVQYTLVGLCLALFYLLLVSLSEQLPFSTAYAAASSACVLLLSYYIAHIVQSLLGGTLFGAALALIYGAIYLLLNMEDYALLTGTLLIFIALASVMIATRKVDWYQLTQPSTPQPPPLPQTPSET